jgi:signal transduction histidine kinase
MAGRIKTPKAELKIRGWAAPHWMEQKRRYNRAPINGAKCRSEGAMALSKLQLRIAQSPVLRYGLAVLSVSAALGGALLIERLQLRNITLFLFAIAVAAWYGGTGAAVLALLLSWISFAYFFVEPSNSIPYFILFALFAWLVSWFSSVRRRVEAELTERKRHEQEIENLNQELARRSTELEAINKELEAFAYSVSHDLRAPLRHIAGFTELLQKKVASLLDEKSKHYIGMILESAKRMGNLIDDLLAFSRIGRAETQKTQVSMEQLVKEALTEVRQDTEGRNIAWKIGALPDFYGDRSMLRLVLVNLISNAIKFTRTREQAKIEIGCPNENKDDLVVFVRDNGVGFDMKYVNKLFGVFQRLHESAAFEGTGIGLATVQRIIHRHGGKVWAEGAVDSGATFYFSAPKAQGQIWRP